MMSDIKTSTLVGLKWHVARRPEGSAQVRFRFGGRLISISTGKKNPSAVTAAEARQLIEDWFKREKRRWVPPSDRRAEYAAEVERFITFVMAGRAPRTVMEARRLLTRFGAVLEVKAVHEVTKDLCESKRGPLLDGLAARHQKAFLTIARKFCNWEVAEGNMPAFPLVNFKNPSRMEFPVRDVIWTDDRFEATLPHLRPDDQEILLVIRWSGLDPADIWGLTPKHFMLEPFLKFHKVRAKAKSTVETIDQPVSSRIRAIITRRLERPIDGRLWKTAARSETFATNLLDRVKTAQRAAGYTDMLDIKSLRHTFATYHAGRYIRGEGGPPMEELRRWLGHAPDSRVLERVYVHATSSDRFMD